MQTKSINDNHKRIINFRFFLFTAVCIVISALLARLFFINAFCSVLFFVVFTTLLLVFFIGILRSGRGQIKAVAFIVSLIVSISVYGVFISEVNNWHAAGFVSERVYSVEGRVDSNIIKNHNRIIVIDSVCLESQSVKGKLRIYLSESDGGMEFAREGDIVSFSAKVTGTDINKNYRTNQRYYASVDQADMTLRLGKPTLLQTVRSKIYAALTDNLSKDYADISYSMLTGDKENLPIEISDYFRSSGLAHLLAVSGLHINFLMLLIMFPLKKVRAKKWLIFSLVTLALGAYVLIADFSPSVIRASIMGIIGLATTMVGRPKDIFNNLCLAVSIILVAKPQYLFDIGFLMSVFAVFGIILFASPIAKGLRKIKFPKFLASIISVVVSAQIGVLPVTIFFFRSISIYTLVANIVLTYVIMVTFMLLLIGVVLTVFLPFMGFLLKVAGLGMLAIDSTAQFVAELPFARLIVFSLLPIFVCYLIYFIASRFIRKEKVSGLISAICMILCVIITLSFNFSISIKNTITPVSTSYYDVTSVVTVGSSVYVIGDLQSSYDVTKTLVSIRARKVDAVFISRLNAKTAQQVIALSYNYSGFTIYFPLVENITGLDLLIGKVDFYGFEESCNVFGKIYGEFDGEKFLCYRLDNDISALFVPLSIDNSKIPASLTKDADIIRSYERFSSFSGISMINALDSEGSFDSNTIFLSEIQSTIYSYKTNKTKRVKLQN